MMALRGGRSNALETPEVAAKRQSLGPSAKGAIFSTMPVLMPINWWLLMAWISRNGGIRPAISVEDHRAWIFFLGCYFDMRSCHWNWQLVGRVFCNVCLVKLLHDSSVCHKNISCHSRWLPAGSNGSNFQCHPILTTFLDRFWVREGADGSRKAIRREAHRRVSLWWSDAIPQRPLVMTWVGHTHGASTFGWRCLWNLDCEIVQTKSDFSDSSCFL